LRRAVERRAVVIKGTVQRVGLRPFACPLASELRLGGFVRNQSGSVHIEVEGDPPQLDRFLDEVSYHPPRLAHLDDLSWEPGPPEGDQELRVDESLKDDSRYIRIAPGVATSVACRSELFDPANRLLDSVDSRTTP